MARVRVGMGVFHWAPDERRILLKRAVEKKTAELAWFDIPELAETPKEKRFRWRNLRRSRFCAR